MIDLDRFEDFGYADVVDTGKSRKEMCKILRGNAKKLGIKIKIKYIRKWPKGTVIWDVRTGRVARVTE